MKRVWIVEMWDEGRQRWDPTVGCRLSRCAARTERALWRGNNPDDKFRVRAYVPEKGEK